MDKEKSSTVVEFEISFTDVLYLTNQNRIPPEIKRLFKKRKLSHRVLPIKKFADVRDRLDLIGTVVIDTQESDASQHDQLARIIEYLEIENIGMILLTDRPEMPLKSFSISPSRTSFSMIDTMESISLDELWVKIIANLAHRKKSTGITTKPFLPRKHVLRSHKNKLAEQLSMTKTLADNLAEQLRLAGLVQQDFLPAQLPNTNEVQWATAFLPAEWVSGDIYDVVRIDENHIGFYVADVVGHGMPAALLTIFLKQALLMRETFENNYRIFPPADVIKNLNTRMTAQKLSGYQFATCCYCLLNTQNLQLTYARAGHPYPILIKSGEEPKQLEIRGSLLGVFEQSEYVQETVQLQPGDKLLLYSDGAESFIGSFNDQTGFSFNQEFHNTKTLPIVDMIDGLNTIARNKKIEPAEIDDITILGLEILP